MSKDFEVFFMVILLYILYGLNIANSKFGVSVYLSEL